MKKEFTLLLVFQAMLIMLSCGSGDFSPGRALNNGPVIGGFTSGDYGYAVYDIEEESLVMDHNIDEEFIPASVTKLFTALFAIDMLGGDFIFTTEILYTGSIKDGIIHGDLYIRGSGDPELTIEQLARIARIMKGKGIRGITGRFFYDDSILQCEDTLDPNMPDYAPYNCGIGALNLNGNMVNLVRRADKSNGQLKYEFIPSVPSITYTVYSEKGVFPFVSYNFRGGRENWMVPEQRLLAAKHQLPVKKSALFTAWTFYRLCETNGIKLQNPVPGTAPGDSKELCTHKSRTIHDIIPDMLKTSDNLTAEVLGRTALKKYNKGKNPVKYSDAVSDYFSSRFSSIKWNSFRLQNGSGLSSDGRITPGQTVAVLMALSKEYNLEDILPMSGESGTLKSRLDSPALLFRIFAKTGSIYYSSTLAGVIYGATGKRYLFAVFIDGKLQRQVFDQKTVKDINDSTVAEKWSRKATSGIDGFINGIIPSL